MPRKTLALIFGLVLVTIVLFVIALRTNNPQPAKEETAVPSVVVEPTSYARASLSMSPNPAVNVRPGQKGSVDVILDSADHDVTGVQLEIAYDPTVLSNVKVVPGPLFQQPNILFDINDAKTGRYTFAPVLQPNQQAIKGTGVVATITFTAKGTVGTQTQLALLGADPNVPEKPGTLITARGVEKSVLKQQAGTLIVIDNNAAPAANTPQTSQPR